MTCEANREKAESRSWSHLPDDILRSILERLYFVDQLRFRAVCRDWQRIHSTKSASIFPWFISIRWCVHKGDDQDGKASPHLLCLLRDPSAGKAFIVCKTTLSKTIKKGDSIYYDPIRCSKYGWVLLSIERGSLLLTNPFAKELIKVPTNLLPQKQKINSHEYASFSTSPRSSDCVILYLKQDFGICTYHLRDKKWTVLEYHELDIQYPGLRRATQPDIAFVQGVFYWIPYGKKTLFSFNAALQKLDTYPITIIPEGDAHFFLVESDGDLLVVRWPRLPENSKRIVLRFDQSRKVFVKVNSLGNRLLFRRDGSSISVAAEGEASAIPSTLHVKGIPTDSDGTVRSFLYVSGKCIPMSQESSDWNRFSCAFQRFWLQPSNF